jgi:thiamine kinase-like enzyme
MIDLIRKTILEKWSDFDFNRPVPRKIDFIKFNFKRYTYELGSFNFFFFLDDEPTPVLFGKMKRNVEYNELLKNEYENIIYFSDKTDGGLQESLPSPIGLIDIQGHMLLLEKAIKLQTLIEKNSAEIINSYSDRIIEWIAEFHKSTEPTNCRKSLRSYLLDLANLFQESFALEKKEEEFTFELKSKIESSHWDGWHLVHTHGDLGLRNILVDKSSIKVVDWELSERFGIPIYDVIKFLFRLYYGTARGTLSTEELFCQLVSGGHKYSYQFWNQINRYMDALGFSVDKSFQELWIGLFLLKMSTIEYQFFGKHYYEDRRWRGVLQAFLMKGKTVFFCNS